MATEQMRSLRLLAALPVLAAAFVFGCSASSADSASRVSNGPPVVGSGGSSNGGSNIGIDTPNSDAGALPPEMETDQTFRAPVATGRVLWTSNPDSGRVALIDAQTLKVRMTNAGFGPTYLAAIPTTDGSNAAIVLNTGSHDASFIRATDTDIVVTSVDTNTGDNAWSISDDGHFAIAWTDAAQIQGTAPDPSDGFSELTVIDLSVTPPASTRLSVGFRPSQVVFDAKKSHAFAVVDEGISVIDLSKAPLVTNLISLTKPGGTAARDVNIARDGSFAVVRVDGNANVDIVDLAASDGAIQTLTLASDPTDLDLSSDSKTATAVLGNASPPAIVTFTVPQPGADLTGTPVPGELVRSVTLAPNDDVALLYANAVPSNDLTLLDTTPGNAPRYRTVDLKSPVQRVYVSPDSSTAITFQAPPSGSMKKGIFSAVPTTVGTGARPPKIVGTDAQPQDVAFSDAKTGKALVTVHDSASTVRGVYLVGLANSEQNFISLASEPLPGASGFVPDVRVGFVAQKHPEGRITFINLDTGVTQTLTGFEIAARVVQ